MESVGDASMQQKIPMLSNNQHMNIMINFFLKITHSKHNASNPCNSVRVHWYSYEKYFPFLTSDYLSGSDCHDECVVYLLMNNKPMIRSLEEYMFCSIMKAYNAKCSLVGWVVLT